MAVIGGGGRQCGRLNGRWCSSRRGERVSLVKDIARRVVVGLARAIHVLQAQGRKGEEGLGFGMVASAICQ